MQTILLVEDDESFRYAVERQLVIAGYTVIARSGGTAALDEIELKQPVDLMLADIRLGPGKLHGIALASMARWRRPEIGILLMTGYPEMMIAAEGTAYRTIMKPADLSLLVDEVKAALAA